MPTNRAITRPSSEPVSMRPIVDRQTPVKTLPSLVVGNKPNVPLHVIHPEKSRTRTVYFKTVRNMVTLTVRVHEAWVTADIKCSLLLSEKGSIKRHIKVLVHFSYYLLSQWTVPNIAIHKAAGSLATGRSLQNGKKYRWQERPSDTVPPLPASGMGWWNDGIVPVKSCNYREPWGRRLCK